MVLMMRPSAKRKAVDLCRDRILLLEDELRLVNQDHEILLVEIELKGDDNAETAEDPLRD